VCVKGGFVAELRAIMAAGYQAEARFYRDVAPQLGHGLATCYFAGIDADRDQGVVILDDLVAAGARFCDAREPLSIDQAAAGLEVLARWHSRSDIREPWLDEPPVIRPALRGLLTRQTLAAAAASATSRPVIDVLADHDRYLTAFDALWAFADTRPRGLVHGDANLTNVYFDATDAPRFLDWQFASYSDVFHDVALFLIGSLTVEDRRAHEETLIRGYLTARGPSAETFDEAWRAYGAHSLHGTMYAIIPNEMQPAEIRAAFADRFAQAVIDHDTYAILGV
jgi:aminoglycoside phosphotransferase (APT) family kinase protein